MLTTGPMSVFVIHRLLLFLTLNMYTNIDPKLRNKLHGPIHYTICDTCVFNDHAFYTLL